MSGSIRSVAPTSQVRGSRARDRRGLTCEGAHCEKRMDFPDLRRTVLPNGLTVLVCPWSESPTAAVLIIYGAGSVHEPPGCTGLAHLTEHMMFRGTPDRPEGAIDELTNAMGGVNNAMTTGDYAAYYFAVPGEHWREAIAVEADRMHRCEMGADAFETERRIAIEERKMLEDDPEAMLDEALEALAFRRHPYGLPVVGLLPHLESATVDDLRSFYRTRYVPANAVLVVVGDVDAEVVGESAAELFSDVPRSPVPPSEAPVEGPQTEPRSLALEREASVPRLSVGFHCPGAVNADSATLSVLAALLASGRTSRLHSRLVTGEGTATDVCVSHILQKDPGLLTISAELAPGERPGACEGVILRVLAELRRDGLSGGELDRARRHAVLDAWLGRETPLGLAGFLGFWEQLGGWELGVEFEERLIGVEADDVTAVLDAHLNPETRSTAWLVDPTR